MTNLLPFQGVDNAVMVKSIVRGALSSFSDDARKSLIQGLFSVVGQCWNIEPSKRLTAVECKTALSWMVSNPSLRSVPSI